MKKIFKLSLCLSYIAFSVAHAQTEYSGSLKMFVVPSAAEINWSTPRTLAKTYLLSYGTRLAKSLRYDKATKTGMGHGIVHYQCTDLNNVQRDIYTAISGQSVKKITNSILLKERLGLLVFMANYPDGYVESAEHIKHFLSAHTGRREKSEGKGVHKLTPRFFEYPVTKKQCSDIHDFHTAYSSVMLGDSPSLEVLTQKWNDQDTSSLIAYGLFVDPVERYNQRKKEIAEGVPANLLTSLGAGCTSYAQAFLKIAGYYDNKQFDKSWVRTLNIGESKIRVPQSEVVKDAFASDFELLKIIFNEDKNAPKAGDVKFTDILFKKEFKSWDDVPQDGETSQTVSKSFHDPELMYRFLDGSVNCLTKNSDAKKSKSEKTIQGGCTEEVQSWLDNNSLKPSLTKITLESEEDGRHFVKEIVGVKFSPKE